MSKFLLEEQLTVVSTQTLHQIFKSKYGADSIALYMFYYYTAKWQKTNQPRATANFCMKGLSWGDTKFKRAKRILRKCDLIEDIFAKDKKGKITGWYIKIKYLWKKETIKKIKPTPPENPPTGEQSINTLNDNKIKCLKCNKKKFSSIKDIQEQDLQEIAQKYNVSIGFVKLQFEKMKNWLVAKGKKYKNYRRALMNWVLGDIQRNIEMRQKDPIKKNVDVRDILPEINKSFKPVSTKGFENFKKEAYKKIGRKYDK